MRMIVGECRGKTMETSGLWRTAVAFNVPARAMRAFRIALFGQLRRVVPLEEHGGLPFVPQRRDAAGREGEEARMVRREPEPARTDHSRHVPVREQQHRTF